MTLKKALKLVEEKYEEAQKSSYIRKPLAWALFKVWRMADQAEKERVSDEND